MVPTEYWYSRIYPNANRVLPRMNDSCSFESTHNFYILHFFPWFLLTTIPKIQFCHFLMMAMCLKMGDSWMICAHISSYLEKIVLIVTYFTVDYAHTYFLMELLNFLLRQYRIICTLTELTIFRLQWKIKKHDGLNEIQLKRRL